MITWEPGDVVRLDPEALRAEFVRLLTVDSETTDARRRDYNQAVFLPDDGARWGGVAVFNGTSLDMVLAKFDRAATNLGRKASA